MIYEESIAFREPAGSLDIRPPSPRDAAAVWRLVEKTPALDANSPYAYLLLCSHFARTGVVAYAGRELAGFVLGYPRPDDAATAFVWQVAVAQQARGRGLGGRLLDAWFARCARRANLRFLEATVTPTNQASRALFSSFAARHRARLRERVAFPGSFFPDGIPHEDELGIRIGPVQLVRASSPHQEEIG